DPLLLALLLFLFPFARLLFSVALFLLAFAAVLFALLFHQSVRFLPSRGDIRRLPEWFRGPFRRCPQSKDQPPSNASAHSVCDVLCPTSHTLFLYLGVESVCAGWDFLPVSAVRNSCRTTRTFNKIPCSAMRFWMDSNCAGVTSAGLFATSISTRSSSSSELAMALSPP